MNFRLYDAHNHLQDDRLAPHREAILAALQREGVAGMVVNGSCEADWPGGAGARPPAYPGDPVLRLSSVVREGAVN